MPKMREATLRKLISNGETNTVELKVAVPRPSEMAERLCGLANAQGGFVIIGIEDSALKIVGVPKSRMAMTKDVVLRAARQIEPPLLLDPPEPDVYILDGKQVVVATVPPNRGALYQASGVFWIHKGTYTIPLSAVEIMEVAHDRGLISWETLPTYRATMNDINVAKLEALLKQRSSQGLQDGRFEDVEKVLLGMQCATTKSNGEIVPTNAGILFLGHEPQQFFIQSEVVCILFSNELGVGGYIDRKIIKGTIQELVDGAEEFLNKYVAVGAKIVGWKRIDIPEYPIEALREAVVNAVIHRDYSKEGESIRIFYYPDRIEIHSPGLLLPGITIGQMERGEVRSKLRNPVLAGLLRDIPGYMERIGSGIRLMLSETKRMGLPNPQFREMGEFIVSFRNDHTRSVQLEDTSSNMKQPQQLVLDVLSVSSNPSRMTIPSHIGKREVLAMQYVHEHGSITNHEYREVTGVSEQTANRDLERMVKAGTLTSVGEKRGRYYKLP